MEKMIKNFKGKIASIFLRFPGFAVSKFWLWYYQTKDAGVILNGCRSLVYCLMLNCRGFQSQRINFDKFK